MMGLRETGDKSPMLRIQFSERGQKFTFVYKALKFHCVYFGN